MCLMGLCCNIEFQKVFEGAYAIITLICKSKRSNISKACERMRHTLKDG